MIASDSFRADERIAETELFEIVRGLDAEGRPVFMKRMRDAADPKLAQARLRREWEIGKGLEHPQILRYRGLFMTEGRLALVMEDEGLQVLGQLVVDGGWPLERFYPIARQLTRAIAYLHAEGIIHKDVCPTNVFVGETGLRLGGLGVATRLRRESASERNPLHLEGALAYMSPEQTGRMNRAYDHRSDLYALGAIFYELLTGRRPVEGADALEIIHAHIARAPLPPASLRPDLPERLSALVMRLLAKDAGDRYQSAVGVLADLERLSGGHDSPAQGPSARAAEDADDGAAADWALGSEDVPLGMPIPETLYGREAELGELFAAFERSREGRPELVLVSGYSGIGKTSLVREIERPLIEAQGFFSSGKFDQFEHSRPYSAFAQAFRGLMRQILAGSDAALAEWRARIRAAVGNRGQLVCEIVPELAWVIGEQPEVADLGPAEAETRFVNVMQAFLGALVSPDQPLTLFLDDLQWADLASLRLLKLSLLDGDLGGLLILGAYRDNEVEAGHPLLLTLAEIRAAGCAVGEIELGPLSLESTTRLIADTLRSDAARCAPLAALLYARSEGNPFFLKALLTQLYERELLRFEPERHRWTWALDAIERLEVADDVVSFVLDRLQGLPRTTRAILPIAANFGARFDLSSLSAAAAAQPADVQQALWPALEQGLVLPVGNAYKYLGDESENRGQNHDQRQARTRKQGQREAGAEPSAERAYERPAEISLERIAYAFAHDRVQQAAAALVSEEERARIRGTIGRNLLARAGAAERRDRALEIADHLNAAPAPSETAERLALARLNLEAARKAKQAIAFEPARAYLETGIALLGAEGWSEDYETMHALRAEAAETAYLMGDDEGVETHSAEILTHARTVLDRVPGHAIRALHHSVQHRNAESLSVTREALAALGVNLPDKPNSLSILRGLLSTKRRIEKRSIEELLAQPAMKDPETLEAMRLLMEASQPAFYSEPELFPHLAFELVRLSLLHGNSPYSAWGYAIYALVLYSAFGSTETATRYLLFSEELHDRIGAPELNCKMQVVLYHGFRHATYAFGASADKLREALDLGIEVGDSDYGSLAAELMGQYRFYQGASLEPAEREMERMGQAIVKLKQVRKLHNLNQYRQLARNLIGDGEDPLRLTGSIYDEAVELPLLQEANDASYQFHFYYVRGYQRFLFGHREAALEDLERCKAFEKAVPAQGVQFQHTFLHALVLLSTLPTGGGDERPDRSRLRQARRLTKKVGKRAVHGPMNYENKHRFLRAELARVKGDALLAADLYEQAVAASVEHGFQHEAALALERAAAFHAEQGRKAVAGRYEKLAVEAFERWGARAKVTSMTARQPWLRPAASVRAPDTASPDAKTDPATMSEQLDLRTVIKAGQALSGEIRVANYLERLMDVVVENAGAERGYLIAEEGGALVVEARVLPEAESDSPEAPSDAGPVAEENLPTGILGFVARTGETVVANDPAESGAFINDPYVRAARPRSVLCLPLVNRGRLVGLLYLENRLVADAFTPDRVELLELLSTQAAISVENGRLYSRLESYSQSLEDKVAERTGELAEKNVELERVLDDLRASQRQLVHTAKMASLGELTAGIAHEIKNPLNFINNFAEVSAELLGELKEELQRVQGSLPADVRGEIEELTGMVGENLERIAGHGKRADGIIAGMLFHSRSGSGDLQPTDLNDLIELALNLAYHGMRAQHASFNAKLSTDFDARVGEVEVLPQDLSRALLNIFNNGLQSVHARSQAGDADYRPELRVETRDLGDAVEIFIHDNGLGLSESLKDRIFQPFFTTKAAGEGTGLGLSLTYEIVTEGHGGEIQVDGREGEFASFRIRLPKEREEGEGT